MDHARRHLADATVNKGTAFTIAERSALGRLPARVETLDEQATRSYAQLLAQPDDLAKYIYLDALHDRNDVLYYRLLADHLAELLPIVYDPTIGDAIQQWSRDCRQSRAVYLSIDLIVVSDAEEILGIGDWGVNGPT